MSSGVGGTPAPSLRATPGQATESSRVIVGVGEGAMGGTQALDNSAACTGLHVRLGLTSSAL